MNEPDKIEEQLGHRLPEEARKLLEKALVDKQRHLTERMKATLPEGSEPCVMFHPTPFPATAR